jgi:hypothetical protein
MRTALEELIEEDTHDLTEPTHALVFVEYDGYVTATSRRLTGCEIDVERLHLVGILKILLVDDLPPDGTPVKNGPILVDDLAGVVHRLVREQYAHRGPPRRSIHEDFLHFAH